VNAGRVTLFAGSAILVAGVVLFFVGLRPPPPRTFHGPVKDLLPKIEELPGWSVEYLPIADTPEMKAKVDEVLNYDDAVFAVYTRGVERISIYIAYWMPSKMPYRMIATHTPDVCWVGGGWRTEEASNGVVLASDEGIRLLACEQRTMSLNGHREHVIFWHVAEGKSLLYGIQGPAPWHAAITDLFSRRLNQRPEQFFVRVSSPNSVYWGTHPLLARLRTSILRES
jgi:hypothetical protein